MSDQTEPETTAIPPLRSRRAVIAGAIGGAAGLLAGRLGKPDGASAAAGSTMIIGSQANNAGSADTQLLTNSNVVAFKLLQQGPGTALMGYTNTPTGTTRGVYGRVDSPNGDGVQARNAGAAGSGVAVRAVGGNNVGVAATTDAGDFAVTGTGSSGGVYGTAPGVGVQGAATTGTGVYGSSNSGYGVWGVSSTGAGVVGDINGGSSATGVSGYSQNGNGVRGASSNNDGVVGTSTNLAGVAGGSVNSTGVYGESVYGYAAYFVGDVGVAGTLSKSAGSFIIDHPLDPSRKTLSHSFVESPDMLNIYNGIVTTDAAGEATVELPAWFGALNRDFRYQLTPVGGWSEAWVSAKVKGNKFSVATTKPNQEVSWQLTGIRQDAYANEHRIPVEQDKPKAERGTYLNPKEHGKPESAGRDHATRQRMRKQMLAARPVPPAPSNG